MKKRTVMIIDDDLSIRKLLKAALEKNGYIAILHYSGEEAIESIAKCPAGAIDAVILDIVLPGIDGLEVLKKIRNHPLHRQVPVIMLTCKNSETETVLGLEMGADDYLSKPVRYHELIARIKTVLKRTSVNFQNKPELLTAHGIEINLENRSVLINKTPVIFTYMEFELLSLLAQNPGRVFSRDKLLDILWHDEQYVETRTVDVHIRRVRKKIEEHGLNPDLIETIRGIGYRMYK